MQAKNLDEICLIPSASPNDIISRSECKTRDFWGKLPLWIAPMSSLINLSNIDEFKLAGFNSILPRTVPYNDRIEFMKKGYTVAFGLNEAIDLLERENDGNIMWSICIDQANGHMKKLIDTCRNLRDKFGDDIWIMTGNIANPEMYIHYAKAGIDAVRIGIGSGNVCTTSIQTGIHYPMASLIKNTWWVKQRLKDSNEEYESLPLIIADGGFTSISQVIKALALGADAVMLGRIIAQMKEACGPIIWDEGIQKRLYYGMSTERAQGEINSTKLGSPSFLKKSEGAEKFVDIVTTMDDFIKDFEHALSSCMSYTGHTDIRDFIGKIKYHSMNPTTLNKNGKYMR